jgi:NifU-like protein involved in Fe-S cluster formation
MNADAIYDRAYNPRFSHKGESYTHLAVGANQSCGDEVTLYCTVDASETILTITHQCRACALCSASADLLAETLCNRTITEIAGYNSEELQKAFEIPISPSRVSCVTLPLHTLQKNLAPRTDSN